MTTSRPPDARRVFAASVLAGETLVLVLAALVAVRLDLVPSAQAWGFTAALVLLGLLAIGLLRTRAGYALGWVVQIGMLAASTTVPTMIVLAVVFLMLWVGALALGARIDRERGERTAAEPGH